jgi:hypothetical protein
MLTTTTTAPTTRQTDLGAIRRDYTTEEAAAILGVRPQTLRMALCRDGNYYGIRPTKRPNRMLAWPSATVDAVARGEVA